METISFDTKPRAIDPTEGNLFRVFHLLVGQMNNMSEKIDNLEKIISVSAHQQPVAPREPIEIDEACKILHKAKPTVYALVNKRAIPCYKSGNKLFFYKDELLAHIESGKRKTAREINESIKQKAR